MAGYADDFYVKDNIIGYTGDLNDNPTVYFADAGGVNPKLVKVGNKQQVLVQYGHITQLHQRDWNIGREKVREAFSYNIYNSEKDGKAKETVLPMEWGGKVDERKLDDDGFFVLHPSRNRFEPATKGNLDVLAGAIARFTEIKAMYKPGFVRPKGS